MIFVKDTIKTKDKRITRTDWEKTGSAYLLYFYSFIGNKRVYVSSAITRSKKHRKKEYKEAFNHIQKACDYFEDNNKWEDET